jgi:hypothetical protein
MRLVQLSAIGAILGNGRFEKAANEAIWHDFIDREAPWTFSELMRVLEITPVDCALRPLLFLEYYKVYTNGGGSIAASFEETMIDPYGSLFMDQLSRLIEEGFERHDLVKMASQQRNEYLRTKASNKFTKDSFLKLPLEVTPIKTLSRDTRKPSFTYMGGRTYTTGGPNDGTSVVTNRPGHMIKNKQSLEIAEDDRAAKRCVIRCEHNRHRLTLTADRRSIIRPSLYSHNSKFMRPHMSNRRALEFLHLQVARRTPRQRYWIQSTSRKRTSRSWRW